MATPTSSLIFVSVLLVCAGRERHARAQFVKGGGVKGSVKGGESGSALFYKGALGSEFSDGGGTKGSFSAKGFSGGTKGGVALTKGSFPSFGTKGFGVQVEQSSALKGVNYRPQQQDSLKSRGALSSLSQTYQFSGLKSTGIGSGLKGAQESQLTKGYVKGGFGSKQFEPFAELKGVKGSSSSLKGSQLKGAESQWTKGFVKGGGVSGSNQVQQLFGVKGITGNGGVKVSEVKSSWAKGQSVGGVQLGQDGIKGLVKGSVFSNQAKSQVGLKSQNTKGNSLAFLQIRQQSGGTKGLKSRGGSDFYSRQFVKGGGFGIGGEAQQSSSKIRFLKGQNGYAFRHSALHFGSASSRTEHTQHSFSAHGGHQAHFSSYKAKQVVKGAPYQPPVGQQKGSLQQSFSAQTWGSKQGSGTSKSLLAGYQQQQSGGDAKLFSAKQTQQKVQQVGQQKPGLESFKTQQQQQSKVAASQQTIKSAPQLKIQQASGQSQQMSSLKGLKVQQQQSAAASQQTIKSAPLQQVQTAIGQSQQKLSLGGVKIQLQGKAAPQQTVRIDPLQRAVVQSQQKLSFQGLKVQEQRKASPQQAIKVAPLQQVQNAIDQSMQSSQQQQSKQVSFKSPLRLGTFGSGSLQQSAKGVLQQQQQQKG